MTTTTAENMSSPVQTKQELYKFQAAAVTKLSAPEVPAGLLGDDMGLGKTVEAVAIDREKRARYAKDFVDVWRGKPLTLVVAPLSVVRSWERHFKRWNPKLRVHVINPKDRTGFLNYVKQGMFDVFIIHWEGVRLIPDLHRFRWFHVIADEVHRAKNRKAQQTIALKKIPTDHKLGCSGTPADNRPDDFWSVLNWLYPRKFTSYNAFRDYYLKIKWHTADDCEACDKWHKRSFQEIVGCANVDELHAEIEAFYIRRLKEDVWDDMPEKYYTPVEVDLIPQQWRAYNDMRKDMLSWIGSHEDEPIAAPMIISQLQRLQQFAMAHARVEIRKVKKRNCQVCAEHGYSACVGHMKDFVILQEPSSKLDAVMDIIEDNPGKQIVVFSQSKQIVRMLIERLNKRKITSLLYTSDTPSGDGPGQRDRLVAEFQQGERRIFAGTITAGGEGIELTAAHTEIFIDRAWSPSKNKQAEDRCHRIGQKNAVQVYDIMARGTLDRGRNQKIEMKWSWLKQILGDEPMPAEDEVPAYSLKVFDEAIGR